MNTEQLQILKTELNTDPNSYGYAPYLSDFNPPALAEMLNLARATITIIRTDVSAAEIRKCILVDDFIANQTVLMGSWFESLMQSTEASITLKNPNGTNANDLKNLKKMLKDATASEAAVIALASRNGSRVEQLFGEKSTVSFQDVIDAVRLP